ncbi:MAG: acetate--CoA ligase family protein [Roseiarcus sp.]|jgi:acetyltransferase
MTSELPGRRDDVRSHAGRDVSALSAFFSPRSVAVVGASSDPKKPGHTALRNMIAMGYKGKIFPVNPREPAILGLPCFRSVLDIDEPIEACLLMVSSDMALAIAKDLVERKRRFNDVAAVVCMSAGFGELATPEGAKRERDLVETLRSADIRMVGPNCVGVMNTVSGFNTNFDIGEYPSGGISVLTQSGAFGNAFLFAAGAGGRVGLNKFVSVGNMADVQMAELLRFLKDDETTRVIGIYLEGLADPRDFFEAAREVAAVKPIVVLKSGRSALGSTAALSHTGAIAGADAIYDGAFRQFGLVRAGTVAEFYETLRIFSKQPVPRGNRFAVLTHMGGPGTLCIDGISTFPDIEMAPFSRETEAGLRGLLPAAANIGHPPGYIDMTATNSEVLHNHVLTLLFKDPNVDAVIQILGPSLFHDQRRLAEEVASAYHAQGGAKKPLLNVLMFGEFAGELRRGLEDAGLPTFDYPDTVARGAANLAAYGALRGKAAAAPTEKRSGRADGPAAALIAAAAGEGRVSLLEPEAYAVCKQYDVRVPPFRVAQTLQDALTAANEIGYPVVLKVVSAEILHKSDIGGVMLGVGSDGVLEQSYARLVENVRKAAPGVGAPNVLVQKMAPSTTELALGAIRDKLFGPVVMFGLGGIYVEVLKRVGFRLAPFSLEQARKLIHETLPPQLIAGARGKAKMNVDAIAETLVSLGRLMEEQPEVEQVDLNPCLALDDGCMAVDARIILAKR